jgi:hypothetical protein
MRDWYDFEREAINQLRQHFRSIASFRQQCMIVPENHALLACRK